MVKDGMTVDGVSTVSGVISNSSVKMTRSTSFQRESTASNTSYSGYPNSSQTNVEGQHSSSRRSSLLHKRYARRNDTSAPSDFIQSTNLEEMALTTDIPQWLMYTWTTKLKDTSMSDKRAQEVIAEVRSPLKLIPFLNSHGFVLSTDPYLETIHVTCNLV